MTRPAHDYFVAHALLDNRELARVYTDILLHGPTTTDEIRSRRSLSSIIVRQQAHTLARHGVAEQDDDQWTAEVVAGEWQDEHGEIQVGPTLFASYGAAAVNDDIDTFLSRHGREKFLDAVEETLGYLRGEQTRRMAATALDVDAVEGIAITQAIEPIVAVTAEIDPHIDPDAFEVDVHDRSVAEGAYSPDS